jgi:hypothetical protein
MSTLAIGPHHREAPMLIVPSTAGFPLLLKSAGACHRGPQSAAARDSTGTESDWQRRLEWERRNVED